MLGLKTKLISGQNEAVWDARMDARIALVCARRVDPVMLELHNYMVAVLVSL